MTAEQAETFDEFESTAIYADDQALTVMVDGFEGPLDLLLTLARTDKGPSSAFMERSSDIKSPSNPISPRITSRMTLGLVVAGRCGSIDS